MVVAVVVAVAGRGCPEDPHLPLRRGDACVRAGEQRGCVIVAVAVAGRGCPEDPHLPLRSLHLPHRYCADEAVVGAEFYLMECVPGRVISDGGASLAPAERASLWDSINSAISSLHSADHRAIGLGDYGKTTGSYAARQIRTWSRNFEAADGVVQSVEQRPQLTADMRALGQLLGGGDSDGIGSGGRRGLSLLDPEPTCVIHGDIGLHNMLIHPTEPRVSALIDWEISTLGHPLIDLDYAASALPGGWRNEHVSTGAKVEALDGLPTCWQFMTAYHRRRRLPMVTEAAADVAALVNMYRTSAIVRRSDV